MKEKRFEITAFQLKLLAILTMAVDHIGAVILENLNMEQLAVADAWCRDIGRLAFPLFCFFIVEGFHYTHNRTKYAARLALFAVIAEIPYDLAFSHTFFAPSENSVMITLLLGMLSVWGMDFCLEKVRKNEGPDFQKTGYVTAATGIAAAGAALGYFLKCDYGAAGVLAIVILYLFGRGRQKIGFAAAVIWLGLTCGDSEYLALLDLIPLAFYRGTQGHKMKYFFYVFYPAHLLILTGIGKCFGV